MPRGSYLGTLKTEVPTYWDIFFKIKQKERLDEFAGDFSEDLRPEVYRRIREVEAILGTQNPTREHVNEMQQNLEKLCEATTNHKKRQIRDCLVRKFPKIVKWAPHGRAY